MWKWIRRGMMTALFLGVVGGVVVYTGAGSYLRSSGKMIKTVFKDSVPVEFEIQRARDLLEDLIPELQANLKLVASEEVEVASLEREIQTQRGAVAEETGKVQKLRSLLQSSLASFSIGGRDYRREELTQDLSRRFENLRTAEMLLEGKDELLRNRKRSLDAAIQRLERTRIARVELASQIEALEGQFRLLEAQSRGSELHIDGSKLAQTEKVLTELKKRLAVAQRVLAREARFVDEIPLDVVQESTVVERVDAYFARKSGDAVEASGALEAPVATAVATPGR